MATAQKTVAGTGSVSDFLAGVEPERRGDCETLIGLMEDVTGEQPVMWGSMIGFGKYHYRYATGTEGNAFLAGFSPRKSELSIYLMGTYQPGAEAKSAELFARLGKHRLGKACLYVKRLNDIDLDVLKELVRHSTDALRSAYPAK